MDAFRRHNTITDSMHMKQFKEKLKKKAYSKEGETIGEVLVALLISALALLMLAGAITSSSRIITTSKNTMNTYYSNAETVAKMDNNGYSGTMQISFTDTTNNNSISSSINYYKSGDGNQKLFAYKSASVESSNSGGGDG